MASERFRAQIQEFRPIDLSRMIETANEDELRDIGKMAADTLKRITKLPPGEARDAAEGDALRTADDAFAELRKKSRGK